MTRQQALDYFDNTWCLTEVLFSALQGEEAFYRPPYHALRHPFIFYYGHPAALYVNKLRVAGVIDAPMNPYFEQIFETGVDEMSWDDLAKDMMWPSLSEVTEYRKKVYQLVKNIILTHPGFEALPITWNDPLWALFMGFEHERIHIETSSVLMRELPAALLQKPLQWPAYHTSVLDTPDRSAAVNEFVEVVPKGDVIVGKPADWPSFGWDNEYGSRLFAVQAFQVQRQLVSNGEFLEFVKAGGYREKQWWTDEGWHWRTFRNAKWPTFWIPDGPAGLHKYTLRLIFETVQLPLALPAVVNHHEAKAYGAWLSAQHALEGGAVYRLLTEPEHKSLVGLNPTFAKDAVMTMSGSEFREVANLNLAYGAECAVDAIMTPPTPGSAHMSGIVGNVWQWCEDYFASLPGSRGVHPYYDDFSTPCYDGQHNIITGGSFISTGDEASTFARFHFRPHFFQHAGFRLVLSIAAMQTTCADSPPPHVGVWDPSTKRNEKAAAAQAYDKLQRELLLQYGSEEQVVGIGTSVKTVLKACTGYVDRVVDLLADGGGGQSALVIGCSVGGIALKMSNVYDTVLGVDHDASALRIAQEIAETGVVHISRPDEGAIRTDLRVTLPAVPASVFFKQMDPSCLAPDIGFFDCCVLDRVLEKSPSPKGMLGRFSGPRGVVRPGGLLVVASTWCWSEKVSDKSVWLGGIGSLKSHEGLMEALGDEFDLVKRMDIPSLVRHCERRYEVQVMDVSVWRRKHA